MAHCTNCGKEFQVGKSFCPNCGRGVGASTEVATTQRQVVISAALAVPTHQYVPVAATIFCPACGRQLVPTAAVCPSCGTSVGTPKDKSVAVLLAVFLMAWTWVYTYKRDAWKFWVGGVAAFIGAFTAILFVGFVLLFGVWIWAIIDTATKPATYYQRFPRG